MKVNDYFLHASSTVAVEEIAGLEHESMVKRFDLALKHNIF